MSNGLSPEELETLVTELRAQLMQAQKMGSVGALATSITHEFNNILTTIINYAKLGLRHKDNATREKALDKILAAGQRASKITTGLLSYARRGNDRRELSDLVTLVQDVLLLVEKDLMVHRVRLQTQFNGRPHAVVHSAQLQQVILNLIVNARQAMEGGGTLKISVTEHKETGFCEISVGDTGCGMSAEHLHKIFEPYFSTKIADANGQGGTGIGLSLAREVIESHQGRIRVESTLGKGTTFTLKLPAAKPAVTAEALLPAT